MNTLDFFKNKPIKTLDFFKFRPFKTLDFFIFTTFVADYKLNSGMYFPRSIDTYLSAWAAASNHKPLLLRGARQVGKSTAVRHLAAQFDSFVEVNLEKQSSLIQLFKGDLDAVKIVAQLAAVMGQPITPGKTLLFIDEIQASPEAIMALRFFKEDLPALHVIAAGSLLEFALEDLPTFGVGRIHSMFMYPMTFDEFLTANGEDLLLQARNQATAASPLPLPLYQRLVELLREYMLIGGMPEAVSRWVETHNYLACQEVQDDIVVAYEDDFPKYKKKIDPLLLRLTLRSAAVQATKKFVYANVGGGYKTHEIKRALELLTLAGILIPVTHTDANGLPLGAETDNAYRKMLLLDTGLMLRLLNMTTGDISDLTTHILTAETSELVNKGPMAEMMAGLEMLHYRQPNIRQALYYWQRMAKNAEAEIDYISQYKQVVLPVEIKSGTRGGMKSLWSFLREKQLDNAVRCSLENFGTFDYADTLDNGRLRHVALCPLFALSQLERLAKELPWD